jgi:membrane-associated PAP2 superfamily phosphatase
MLQTSEEGRCRWHLCMVTLGFGVLVGLATLLDVDLALSARFYNPALPQPWFLAESGPWLWLYRYGEYAALAMMCGALLVLLGSLVRTAWAGYRRRCLCVILAVVLGPGLLVNGLLQPTWGRPRPRQVEPLGGTQRYRPWWQPGGPGAGKSFPSGHAAMGYILVAGTVLVPCRRRVWPHALALAGALGYGTLLGTARVVQGGHFASDVLWAGGLTCLTVMVLQKALVACPRLRDATA